jgi:hypothetical protein
MPTPLFDWAGVSLPGAAPAVGLPPESRGAEAPRPRMTSGARIVLRDDLRDAEGQPRACLAIPGQLPVAFPSISAAYAALNRMEAVQAGR